MATGKCFSLVRGRVMRVTRLDGCGRPVVTAGCNVITSEGFVSVALTANVEEGEAIRVTNAAGKVCVSDTPPPRFTGYGAEVTFCEVDPELYGMLTSQDVVYDSDGTAVGFRVNSDKDPADAGFALEVWSNIPSVQCEEGAEANYGYLLLPFLQGGNLGDFTIENAAVTFTISGAQTKTGSGWGVGPYDTVPTGAGGVAGKLATAMGRADHLHVQITSIAPPAPGCGCAEEPTGATAGTPGTYTPAGSDTAPDLATLREWAPTASPATAWTTGQYVELGDGSRAFWDGDSYEAGTAP